MELSICNISLDLGAKKDRRRILDDVSFTAAEGSFTSLLGASGAGKSTLLKVIAGIILQDEGTVLFDGVPADNLPSHRRQLGFVFQDMRLFPNMNVEDNVAFPCKAQGMGRAERRARAAELLERVQLGGFGPREVRSLSGGQQQRVALARALAAMPRALLLDEPFSGLDENLRDDMRSLVMDLQREEKLTTIMVTHDAMEALAMSDRIVYLSAGKVVQDGLPAELFESPASAEVAACFGGCSTLEGVVKDGVFRAGALLLPAEGVADGAAEAVVRFKDSSTHPVGAARLGSGEFLACTAAVKKKQYRGSDTLAHLDVDGQDLVVRVTSPVQEGSKTDVVLPRRDVFVFSPGSLSKA